MPPKKYDLYTSFEEVISYVLIINLQLWIYVPVSSMEKT